MKIGLVGSKALLQPHVEAYKALGVTVTAAADWQNQPAAWMCEELNCQPAASLGDMLAECALDMVHIAADPASQMVLAAEALTHGVHVVCEVPLAPSASATQQLLAMAAEHNVRLLPARVNRFGPEYAAAKERLDGGSLGTPAVVRTERVLPIPDELSGDRSIIREEMIKDIDFLVWCFGPVQRVMARSTQGRRHEAGEHALLTMRMANGVIVHLEAGWSSHVQEPRWALEISCRSGMIVHDSRASQGLALDGRALDKSLAGPDSWLLMKNAYIRHLEAVLQCLNAVDNCWDEHSEIAVMAAVDAALQSVTSSEMVLVQGEVQA